MPLMIPDDLKLYFIRVVVPHLTKMDFAAQAKNPLEAADLWHEGYFTDRAGRLHKVESNYLLNVHEIQLAQTSGAIDFDAESSCQICFTEDGPRYANLPASALATTAPRLHMSM